MTERKILGNRGEDAVCKYLEKNGCRLLARNYRSGRNEIDLIFAAGTKTVFVEVKTRRETDASRKENPLAPAQTKNLKRAMADYCRQNRINLEAARLDLAVIFAGSDKQARLLYYRDII